MKMGHLVLACFALSAASLAADVWDAVSDNDDSFLTTRNELIHGSSQVHDLGVRPGSVPDVDWYRIGQKPRSSYEVLVDSTTGNIAPSPSLLQRYDLTGSISLQNSEATTANLGYSRSLRWANTTAAVVAGEFVRVGPAFCAASCTSNHQYQIRALETTISVARYNNAGTQVTVLLMQNAAPGPVVATVFYWNSAGSLLGSSAVTVQPKALSVINTSTVGGVTGTSGSITIAHDAPYGQLNVKSVALEPATGFSFDTPGVYRGGG